MRATVALKGRLMQRVLIALAVVEGLASAGPAGVAGQRPIARDPSYRASSDTAATGDASPFLSYRGPSWRVAFDLGLGGSTVPLYRGAPGQSFTSRAMPAVGPSAELSAWPMFSQWVGVGGFGAGNLSIVDTTGRAWASEWGYGARAFVGVPWLGAVGEAGNLGNTFSETAQTGNAGIPSQSTGMSYDATRVGVGLRVGLPVGNNLEIVRFAERATPRLRELGSNLSVSGPPVDGPLYRARLTIDGFGLEAQYASQTPGLPAAGKNDTPFWSVQVYYALDLFGNPYFRR